MFFSILLILAGFILLIGGANYLVKGASSLAKRLGVRTLVIGLTVVAFGTSAPELVVNLISAGSGATELAVGNILGSNIANILLVLGVTAAIAPIVVEKGTTWKEIPLSLLAAVMLVVFGSDYLLDGVVSDVIGRTDGIALLAFFAIFMYYSYGISKADTKGEKGERIEELAFWKSFGLILAGIIGLVLGGKLIVDGAVTIATDLGVSEHLIGLTIVALGTSLPELATAIVASLKKQVGLAVGNVVGSNIFNIFFVLGTTATVSPLGFSSRALQDGFWLLGVSALLFLALFIGRQKLSRIHGYSFVGLYVVYLIFAIIQK